MKLDSSFKSITIYFSKQWKEKAINLNSSIVLSNQDFLYFVSRNQICWQYGKLEIKLWRNSLPWLVGFETTLAQLEHSTLCLGTILHGPEKYPMMKIVTV